jgi:hypothetical protein
MATIGVLFSGGIDCVLLTALAQRCLPASEPIDLINVAFGPDSSAVGTSQPAHFSSSSSSSPADAVMSASTAQTCTCQCHQNSTSSENHTVRSGAANMEAWRSWYMVPDRLASINALVELGCAQRVPCLLSFDVVAMLMQVCVGLCAFFVFFIYQ